MVESAASTSRQLTKTPWIEDLVSVETCSKQPVCLYACVIRNVHHQLLNNVPIISRFAIRINMGHRLQTDNHNEQCHNYCMLQDIQPDKTVVLVCTNIIFNSQSFKATRMHCQCKTQIASVWALH